jgi:hypothetical protein
MAERLAYTEEVGGSGPSLPTVPSSPNWKGNGPLHRGLDVRVVLGVLQGWCNRQHARL